LKLDIDHALSFLDLLDPNGRHTIASEAPFGSRDGGPLWERGRTHEAGERSWLIRDIESRQQRGSNVYYSVNRPCPDEQRVGANGKNNTDDIIAIRALAFDIDIIKRPFDNSRLIEFIDRTLVGVLRPSLLISTGGGFHLIYLLQNVLKAELFRPALDDEQKARNKALTDMRQRVTQLSHDFEFMLRAIVPSDLNDHIKIDNMSNIDRVMRLPGTVNYPKEEKRSKGQVEALAHTAVDYQCRTDLKALRNRVPGISQIREPVARGAFIKRKNAWPSHTMALYCCEQIRDRGLADTNEIYTHWVMLPLIGMIHDENELTIQEAEDCFMEAISGGERYGGPGRGYAYFLRQWRSHRPEIKRSGTRSLGSLILFCQKHGIDIPWIPNFIYREDPDEKAAAVQTVFEALTDQGYKVPGEQMLWTPVWRYES
jgi:hypothetical protein